MTTLGAHDQGFVPVPPESVYPVVADVRRYPQWWVGTAVSGQDPGLRLKLPGAPAAVVRTERARPGVGLFLRLEDSMEGTFEWYLEPFEEGTIVNCLLQLNLADPPRRARRRLLRLRTGVHAGLAGLERHLA